MHKSGSSGHPIWLSRLGLFLLLANPNSFADSSGVTSGSEPTALTQFKVSYQAKLMGAKLTATSRLHEIRDDLYEYRFNTSSMLGKVTEMSRFTLTANAELVPLLYKYKVSAMGSKKRINLAFDWKKGRVTDRAATPDWTLDLPSGALDPLSMQLQLREDVKNGRTSMTYQIAKDGKMKEYHFVVEAPEITETLIGPLRTVRVQRDRGDESPKFTTIWLAVDWSHLIAKIRDGKVDGRDQEVVLAGGTVGGIPISPLN